MKSLKKVSTPKRAKQTKNLKGLPKIQYTVRNGKKLQTGV